MLFKGYNINADPYLLPSYKLSPFSNEDLRSNREFSSANNAQEYFEKRFKGSHFYYTSNGRSALNIALKNLNLNSEDTVSIITTSQNFYISGCVTKEIEKVCKWNRDVSASTSVILVNHEFGFPYGALEELQKFNLPIIEDCAYSFNSQSLTQTTGRLGDFIIYSLPKFFPMQTGGLLISKNKLSLINELPLEEKEFISNIVSHYIPYVDQFSELRRTHYAYLANKFKELGIQTRFGNLAQDVVPGVFMFKLPDHGIDAKALKSFFYANGVECSIFYGENSFFIPCHHKLSTGDLDYFFTLTDYYLNYK